MNVEFDKESVLKVARFKCRQSLMFMTRYLYRKRQGRKYIVAEPHELIAEALERVLKGEIKKLIINIAPRYGKTELAVKNFIAHGLALNPAAKFIHLTYSAKLALDNSEEAKDIVMSEPFQELFDVQIKKDSKAKDKWYTTVGGGVYAAATGGQVTGFGAGKVDEGDAEENGTIDGNSLDEFFTGMSEYSTKGEFGGALIIDDPIKPEDGHSMAKRTRINERFESTLRNRVNSRHTPIIIIQQRVHENDLSGYLMEAEPDGWTVLRLPCLKEDGTALWPLKHTVEELQKLQRINSYVFEAQLQQDPKPIKKGGEFYKLFDLKRNTVVNKLLNGLPYLYNPTIALHVTFDFNVHPYMTCLIHQVVGKKVIQIDEICLRSPRNRTEDVCRELCKRYKGHTAGMFIYGDPSGKKEDTRSEKGSNDYTIIMRELKEFRPSQRVADSAPSVVMRGKWINAVFSENVDGLEFIIGDNCQHTLADYQFGKEDSDGTKLKEVEKDPVTGIPSQKYHHCTDANDYFYCFAFSSQFYRYQKMGSSSGGGHKTGKVANRNSY